MELRRDWLQQHAPLEISDSETRHAADEDVSWAEHLSVAQATRAPKKSRTPKPKDELLFIGMSDGSAYEVASLRKGTNVVAAMDTRKDDHVTVGRKTYDLSDGAGAAKYLAAIGVSGDKMPALLAILERTNSDARDEVGQIIRVYQQAEAGARVLDRVVVSGHSAGGSVWGDHNGALDLGIMGELAAIFPVAAGQVRDLALSACFSGEEGKMDQYHTWFPNLESIWAYSGSSPGTFSGAQQHLRVWERATRRKDKVADMGAAHRQVARLSHGEDVATWTADEGYQGQVAISLWEARAAVEDQEGVFTAFFDGQQESTDPGRGPLYEYYQKLHRLLGHPELPESDKARWLHRVDCVVRLRYWSKVRQNFGTHYKARLEAAYKTAGRTAPSWMKLSRAEAFEEATAMASLAGMASEVDDAVKLLAGLRDLDPAVIPPQWV